jgi:hypothetical protein
MLPKGQKYSRASQRKIILGTKKLMKDLIKEVSDNIFKHCSKSFLTTIIFICATTICLLVLHIVNSYSEEIKKINTILETKVAKSEMKEFLDYQIESNEKLLNRQIENNKDLLDQQLKSNKDLLDQQLKNNENLLDQQQKLYENKINSLEQKFNNFQSSTLSLPKFN